MKKIIQILFFGILIIVAGTTSFAQRSDSLRFQQGKSEKGVNEKGNSEMNKHYGNHQNQSINKQKAAGRNAGNQQGIKQVKGARPDMSKARGARPPSVVRQSGSGMPRGMGKPGGANRHGGR